MHITDSPRLLLVMAAGAAALLFAAGCRPKTPLATSVTPAKAEFVGNQACMECHEKEFRAHKGSHHDRTLYVADRAGLGDLSPEIGAIPGTVYEITERDGKFFFGRKGDEKSRTQLRYAMGSGKAGMTFVGLTENKQVIELRMSRIAGTGQWYLTPGQETHGNVDVGLVHEPEGTTRCFGCHSVPEAVTTIPPAEKFFGVGCEACHGPASLHIAAAQIDGNPDLKIEKLASWGATKLNEHCAKCHRDSAPLELSSLSANATQRFAPFGLMQSPCFQKSNDTLSCTVCHDSHSNASKDPEFYTPACLKCHTSATAKFEVLPGKPATFGGICPVNKREKCVNCHMPARKVFPSTKIPMKMADHLIWAYGKKRK